MMFDYRKALGCATVGISLASFSHVVGQNSGATALRPDDGGPGDLFGHSIATEGEQLVVGAPRHDLNGNNAGAAYLYQHDGFEWSFVQKLSMADGNGAPTAGDAVAISDGWIAVGAGGSDLQGVDSGAVYFFRYDSALGWVETQRFVPDDASGYDYFSSRIVMRGEHFFGSSLLDDDRGPQSGSVYWLRPGNDGWVFGQKLSASDGATEDWFGMSLATDGERLVVGAPRHDEMGSNAGAVYVFEFDPTSEQWVETAKLVPSDAALSDEDLWFGQHVAVTSSHIVVGAGWTDGSRFSQTAAYVYTLGTGGWEESAKLVPSGDPVGRASVAIHNDSIFVGARGFPQFEQRGAVYRFDWDGVSWTEEAILQPDDILPEDNFGAPVVTDSGWLATGAVAESTENPGQVFVFDIGASPRLTIEPRPLSSGAYAEFTVTNGNAGALTWLLFSLDGSDPTFIPALNVVVDLDQPQIAAGPRRADSEGRTVWSGAMPTVARVTPVWFQAVQFELVTNSIATEIVP